MKTIEHIEDIKKLSIFNDKEKTVYKSLIMIYIQIEEWLSDKFNK